MPTGAPDQSSAPAAPHRAGPASRLRQWAECDGAAVWRVKGAELQLIGQEDFKRPPGVDSSAWTRTLSTATGEALRQGTAGLVRAGESHLVLLPAPDGTWVAALLGDEHLVARFKKQGRLLADTLAALIPENQSAPSPDALSSFATSLLRAGTHAATACATADGTRELLRAERVSIFERGLRGWKLVACSGVRRLDPHSAASKDLLRRFLAILAGGSEPDTIAAPLSQWCADADADHTGILAEKCTIPERTLKMLAPIVTHALHTRRSLLRRGLLLPPGGTPAAKRASWLRRGILAGTALLFAAILLWPVRQTFSGRCELLPSQRAEIAVGTRGTIREVLAAEGRQVAAGETLFRLEAFDAAAKRDSAQQREARAHADARNAQQTGDMAAFRQARIEAARAGAEVRQFEDVLDAATVESPVEGIVLTKDLHLKRGQAVDEGEILCEVASLESWDLRIDIRESDAGALEAALAGGTPLPVRYALHSHSHLNLTATLGSTREISRMAYPVEGQTVVYVTIPGVPLPEHLRSGLRPGFSGFAKIEGPRRPLLIQAIGRLANLARLHIFL